MPSSTEATQDLLRRLADGLDGPRRTARHARNVTGRGHAAAGPFLQTFPVTMYGVDVCQGVADGIADSGKHRIGEFSEAIVDPQSFAARFNKP